MLPNNWDDVTIEQYVAVMNTLSEEPKGEDGHEKLLIKRIALLTNNDPVWIEDNLTINDLIKMELLLSVPLPQKLVTHFRFNGKRYVVDIDPTKYKAGRYMSAMNQFRDDRIDNMHRIIFQVCRETNWIGKDVEVDLNVIRETIEGFKQLPLKIAAPIRFFFARMSENLTLDIQEYLTNKIKNQTKMLQTEIDSLSDLDG